MTRNRRPWTRPWCLPLCVALASLAVHVVYLETLRDEPAITCLRLSPDGEFFDRWAATIAGQDGAAPDGVFPIGPLYAWFLGALYSLLGRSLLVVQMVQAALGAATAGLVCVTARRMFESRAALITGGLAAAYLPLHFFGALLLPPVLVCFLVAAGLYAAVVGCSRDAAWPFALAGLALGAAALARPNALLFLAAAPLVLWRARELARPRLCAAAFVLPVVLLLALTTLHNFRAEKDLVLVSSQAGINFYIGNSSGAQGVFYPPIPGQDQPEHLNQWASRRVAEANTGRSMRPSEVSNWWFAQGIDYLLAHPAAAAALYLRKALLLIGDYEVPLNFDFYFLADTSVLHRLPVPWFALLFTTGVLGMLTAAGRRDCAVRIVRWFACIYAASVVLFLVTACYRMPLVIPLLVFSGHGTVALAGALRARAWGVAAPAAFAAALLATASLWPTPCGSPESGRAWMRARVSAASALGTRAAPPSLSEAPSASDDPASRLVPKPIEENEP